MTGLLDTSRPLAWCPGCGHPHVLHALDEALVATGLPRERFVLVSDIGCVGLADPYFPTLHTVHTLHGRSVAVAAGIQVGEPGSPERPLKPVVLIGDGGATIGLLHLVHAAQMDVDVTVLLHNNLVYGMTGGQHSGLTPEGMRTTTTPDGSPLRPLDVARILEGAGCGFYARARAPGPDLAPLVAEAVRHPGFAVVEALELCPTFAARIGGMTGKDIDRLAGGDGLRTGVLYRRETPARAARVAAPSDGARAADLLPDAVVPTPAWRRLDRTGRIVAAGRAGERVQTAARLAAAAGAAAGLHVAVRTDNPVTQGRGFSVAEITFSPRPIGYTGLVDPDVVLVTAPEGLAEVESRGTLRPPMRIGRVVIDASVAVPTGLVADRPDLRGRHGGKSSTLGGLVREVARLDWWDRAAWDAALATVDGPARADAARTIAQALDAEGAGGAAGQRG